MSQIKDHSGTVFNSGWDNPGDLTEGTQLYPTAATQNSPVTHDVVHETASPPIRAGLNATPAVSEHITRAESSRVKPPQFESADSTTTGTQSELHRLHSAPSNTPGVLQTGSSDSGTLTIQTAIDSVIRDILTVGALGNKSQVASSTSDSDLRNLLQSPTVVETVGCLSEVTVIASESEVVILLFSTSLAEMTQNESCVTHIVSQHDESTTCSEDDILEFVSQYSLNSDHSPISADSTVEEILRFLMEPMKTRKVAGQNGPCVSQPPTPTTSRDNRYQPDAVINGNFARTSSQTDISVSQPTTPNTLRDVRYQPDAVTSGKLTWTASQSGPTVSQPVTLTTSGDIRCQNNLVASGNVTRTASSVSQSVTPTFSRDICYQPDTMASGNFVRIASQIGASASQPVTSTNLRDIRYQPDVAARTASQTGPSASQHFTPTISMEVRFQPDAVASGDVARSNPTAATSRSKKSSRCQMYGKQFPNIYYLLSHGSEQEFPCLLCWESYDTRGDLADHVATHQDFEYPFRCRSCDSAFPYLRSIRKHQLEHNPELVHQCDWCPRAFDTIAKLNKHYEVHGHGSLEIIRCSLCSRKFRKQNRLLDHVRRNHTKM